MEATIRFEKHLQTSVFHNPMTGNALDTQIIEVRRDPLTGVQSAFNHMLEDKAAVAFPPSDLALIEKLARDSEARCFLCGDRWKMMTPAYPDDLIAGGRIQVGQAVLFPNLFPVSQVHAVIKVGEAHYLPLKEFSAAMVLDAFEASMLLAERLRQRMPEVRVLTINANYLGPAGASIAHPHFQVVGGDQPFTHLENVFALCAQYYRTYGTSYWEDLVEEEKRIGERFIGETGSVNWIASFSPQGNNEILGIVRGKRDFLEMSRDDLRWLAEGFSTVLEGYETLGHSTFNFSVYSGWLDGGDDSFRCYLRVISRQNLHENYRADDSFLQKLLRNEMVFRPPEALAATMRNVFATRRPS